MFQLIKQVARHFHYVLIAGTVAFLVVTFALFIPNTKLLAFGLNFSHIALSDQLTFILSFYFSLFSNFTPLAAVFTVITSVLFGVNVALLVYYIRSMQNKGDGVRVAGVLSLSGLISGFFGIGCAACGSVIITSLLSLIGAGGLLGFLPFGGQEFAVLAPVLLLYSLVTLTRRILAGRVCAVR